MYGCFRNVRWASAWTLWAMLGYMATDRNHVPRVHVPMLPDLEGLDRTRDVEGLERSLTLAGSHK